MHNVSAGIVKRIFDYHILNQQLRQQYTLIEKRQTNLCRRNNTRTWTNQTKRSETRRREDVEWDEAHLTMEFEDKSLTNDNRFGYKSSSTQTQSFELNIPSLLELVILWIREKYETFSKCVLCLARYLVPSNEKRPSPWRKYFVYKWPTDVARWWIFAKSGLIFLTPRVSFVQFLF